MYFGLERGGLQTFFRWAFYLFIAWFPFMFYEGYLFNGTSTRAVNLFVFVEILAVILGLALLGRQRVSFVRSPVTFVFVLLLVSLFVSSLFGVDFHTSFWSKATRTTGLFYFLHIALFYIFFWVAFSEVKRFRQFIAVFLVSAGLFSVASFLGGEGAKLIFASHPMPGITIGNSTFAGMYLYLACMLSIYYFASQPSSQHRWWKNFLPIIFVVSPYLIDFDLWRGAVDVLRNPSAVIGSAQASSLTLFFSVAALFVFWLVSKLKNPRMRRTTLFAGLGVAVVIFALGIRSLLTEGGMIQRLYLSQSTATRPIVWEFSKQAIRERPLLGWGVDNFDRAFQEHYDNRILELKNGGEPFLDRAHNILIDQTIETGYVGVTIYLLVFMTILGSLVYVLVKSKERHDLVFASVLLVYFFGHLLELQTAFDTTVTYVPIACLAAAVGMVFARTRKTIVKSDRDIEIPRLLQRVAGGVLVVIAVSMFIASVPVIKAQNANGAIRRARSSERRLPMYEVLFGSPLDQSAFLWRTSADIQKGVSLDPEVIENETQREGLKKEFDVIATSYEEYLTRYPNDYRALLNLADVYIYQRLFDVDHLDKAHQVLDQAVTLVPQAPQAYWMQAVAYLYQGKFDLAKSWAKRAYDLNPAIEESTRVAQYLQKSIKTFPVIDLYSFKQI